MAYKMTKQGSLDNEITYEFFCDTAADMELIEAQYRTLGSIAIVLEGESGGLEIYITNSSREWTALNITSGSGDDSSSGVGFNVEIVNSLPQEDISEGTIYFLAKNGSQGDSYDEYMYINNNWEKIGNTSIDLSNYATKSEIAGFYTKPNGGIPAADLADTYLTAHQDISGLAPKASPVFTDSISMGRKANTTVGDASVAVGNNTTASAVFTVAEGYNTEAIATYSHAEGQDSRAAGVASHAEGKGGTYTYNNVQYTSQASGMADHIEGYQTRTSAGQPGNHAEGYQTAALGGAAHSEGLLTIASGKFSHAEGAYNTASGSMSHAEGNSTTASGIQSHAEGIHTTSSGSFSHAEGSYSTVSGSSAHVEGGYTNASGDHSHAEGYYTSANNLASHAEGNYTTAAGQAQHVHGEYNVIDSYSNWTIWAANTPYYVGDRVKRNTTYNGETVINGYECKTANSDSSFQPDHWINLGSRMNYATIVGNGLDEDARSNAYALDWEGNGYFAGDIYVGCDSNSDNGFKIARIPVAPVSNGTYILQATVTNGTPTYSWVSLSSLSGVTF